MARKATKGAGGKGAGADKSKRTGKPAKPRKPVRTAKPRKRAKLKPEADRSARDAIAGILESPLVAEVIAAGAAAALATLTQQALSRKAEGGTKNALKDAAKAAAAAMGTLLASELDEIVGRGKGRSKPSKG